jgi:hypothetical protein
MREKVKARWSWHELQFMSRNGPFAPTSDKQHEAFNKMLLELLN